MRRMPPADVEIPFRVGLESVVGFKADPPYKEHSNEQVIDS